MTMSSGSDSKSSGPSTAMVALLAASCGILVANIYYAQPLVGLIGPAVGLSSGQASLIVSLTQLGYAAGLLLLVPLGDLLETRRLVTITIAASIPVLALAGLARSGPVMLGAAALIGLTSVAVQMLVPLAASLTPEARRGQVVGVVMSGLLFGILLARPVASMVADLFGWRVVFFASAVVTLLMVGLLRLTLPVRRPVSRQSYGALLASLFALPIEQPVLRRRAAYQAAVFAGFSLFWTGTPLLLAHEFHESQRGIALFALVGAAGAFAAPIAGRLADKGLARVGTACALLAVCAAFLLALAGGLGHSVVVLALSGVLLDAGVQCNLVFGQRAIYILAPDIRSRLNGVFMAIFFAGGAAGSALTSPVLDSFGWPGICALGAALPLLALGYFAAGQRVRALGPA
jgi:predicted MFS family arabinose efflux permease